jgi:hypothetical protein
MKQGGTHILAFIILLFSCIPLVAQVSIKASVDRNKILIGEPISISVEAYVPLGSDVAWFKSDSIEHFDIAKRSPIDTVNNMDGKKIAQVFTVTSFDSGRWTIPSFEVNVGGKPYYSDSLTIDVAFISFDPKEEYHDIKDIIVVENKVLGYIPWIISGIAIISLILIFLLLNRKKKRPVAIPKNNVARLTAYEDAMRALAELGKKGVQGNEKAYYSEMNDILRKYVSGKFGISTFERTNEELILQLAMMNLPQKPFTSLMQSLRMSDFVKFARYRPAEEDNINNLEIVRSSIDLLNNYSGSAV